MYQISKTEALSTWTIDADNDAWQDAFALAKGAYQKGLVHGMENLSGSTLKGAAKRYGMKYSASRKALLARITEAGIPWCETTGPRGRRLLVIGATAATVAAE